MKYLLALILLISGCARGSVVWHGDKSFSYADRAAIERANEYMADRTGGDPYDIVWDGAGCTDKYHIVLGGRAPEQGGLYSKKEQCIYLDSNVTPMDGAAAHEFGHSRGLGHLPVEASGIMNPYVSPMVWSDRDQEFCTLSGVCPIR